MDQPKTNSAWVRYRSVCYLAGRGLAYGTGDEVVPPAATDNGKYCINCDSARSDTVDVCDSRLDVLADGQLDYVFIGQRLEGADNPQEFLRMVVRKLHKDGHLILHLPVNAQGDYPHVTFTPQSAEFLVAGTGSWIAKDFYERDGRLLQIYKKNNVGRGVIHKPRSSKPRACVCRYGALGDMIILSPLIRRLAEDGYDVTMNITPYGAAVIEHNPYISNLVIQERNAIPNVELGLYWDEWKADYDRYINLSESIEGKLLKVEGRRDFYTHQSWRHAACNKNYYDFTMQLGGYPEDVGGRGELYFSGAEERDARKFRDKYKDRFLVVWALNGSSLHKCYPMLEPTLCTWLPKHPDALVVLVGDKVAQLLEFDHPQVLCKSGVWPIRTSMIMTKYADLVVGPETGVLNAAACFNTPKITFLSHSSHENLCKYWINDYCLEPDPIEAPCYPCHMLHYNFGGPSCPMRHAIDDTTGQPIAEAPCCSFAISPERVMARLDEVYNVCHK